MVPQSCDNCPTLDKVMTNWAGGFNKDMNRLGKFSNGLGNTTFGVVGTVGSALYIGSTSGAGSALGGAVAFSLSLGEVSIGLAQMADALSNSSENTKGLHESGSLPGLVSNLKGHENAEMVDAVSQFLTGTLSGGNIKTIIEAPQTLKSVENGTTAAFGILNTADAVLDTKGVADAAINIVENGAQNNTNKANSQIIWQKEKLDDKQIQGIGNYIDSL